MARLCIYLRVDLDGSAPVAPLFGLCLSHDLCALPRHRLSRPHGCVISLVRFPSSPAWTLFGNSLLLWLSVDGHWEYSPHGEPASSLGRWTLLLVTPRPCVRKAHLPFSQCFCHSTVRTVAAVTSDHKWRDLKQHTRGSHTRAEESFWRTTCPGLLPLGLRTTGSTFSSLGSGAAPSLEAAAPPPPICLWPPASILQGAALPWTPLKCRRGAHQSDRLPWSLRSASHVGGFWKLLDTRGYSLCPILGGHWRSLIPGLPSQGSGRGALGPASPVAPSRGSGSVPALWRRKAAVPSTSPFPCFQLEGQMWPLSLHPGCR